MVECSSPIAGLIMYVVEDMLRAAHLFTMGCVYKALLSYKQVHHRFQYVCKIDWTIRVFKCRYIEGRKCKDGKRVDTFDHIHEIVLSFSVLQQDDHDTSNSKDLDLLKGFCHISITTKLFELLKAPQIIPLRNKCLVSLLLSISPQSTKNS